MQFLLLTNIVGIIASSVAALWIFSSHTDFSPEKNERVFKQSILAINNIHNTEVLRQKFHSSLIDLRKERDRHSTSMNDLIWTTVGLIGLFSVNLLYIIWLRKKQPAPRRRR